MSTQDYEAILRMLAEIAEDIKSTEDDIETDDDDVELPFYLRAGNFDLLID